MQRSVHTTGNGQCLPMCGSFMIMALMNTGIESGQSGASTGPSGASLGPSGTSPSGAESSAVVPSPPSLISKEEHFATFFSSPTERDEIEAVGDLHEAPSGPRSPKPRYPEPEVLTNSEAGPTGVGSTLMPRFNRLPPGVLCGSKEARKYCNPKNAGNKERVAIQHAKFVKKQQRRSRITSQCITRSQTRKTLRTHKNLRRWKSLAAKKHFGVRRACRAHRSSRPSRGCRAPRWAACLPWF